jgi:type IV pilus assembly protein PilA
MKLLEQVFDFLLGFTIAKARSLLAALAILLGVAWLIDWKTNYSEFNQLERAVALAERLDALERRGVSSKEIAELRITLFARLQHVAGRPAAQSLVSLPDRKLWSSTPLAKGIAGALPWLIVTAFALPAFLKIQKHGWTVFAVLQIYAVGLGILNVLVPPYGEWWIDLILVPWGVMVATVLILCAIAVGGPAFQKVRDSSQHKAILNNLRQIAAAADQFYLENGVNKVSLSELIGPDKYIKSLTPVDGERYDDIQLEQGRPIMVKRPSGEVVAYAP